MNKVNPIAMMLSGVMMLRRYLKETEAADRMEGAIADVIREGESVTYDMKPHRDDPTAVGTSEVADAIIEKLKLKVAPRFGGAATRRRRDGPCGSPSPAPRGRSATPSSLASRRGRSRRTSRSSCSCLRSPPRGPERPARVAMELDDCAFPLLQDMVLTDDPRVARGSGRQAPGPGMERADLLKDNGAIFVEQGRAIDEVASDEARVVVVGNPCNTNCMIAAAQASRLGPERFTAMTRLDQNRARTSSPRRRVSRSPRSRTSSSSATTRPRCSPISPTPGSAAARPARHRRRRLARARSGPPGKRGAAIIDARGPSSAASAASAAIDHVRSLNTPGDTIHSVAVRSDGAYGFGEGVWASVPVRRRRPAPTRWCARASSTTTSARSPRPTPSWSRSARP